MPFRFEWRDESKRVICYIAEGDWNWKDYHHAARASTFTLSAVDHPVDSCIDLRGSTRRMMPAGLVAHVRSFGKKLQFCLTGRALVIGMPRQGLDILQLSEHQELTTTDGIVKFVVDDADLESTLNEWQACPPT